MALLLSFPLQVLADTGRSGGLLLQQTFGARPSAMGQAYTGLSDDAFGMLYNPATLTRLKQSEAATQFTQSLVDTRLGYAAFATPISPTQALGIGAAYLDMGKADLYDDAGNLMGTVNAERDLMIHAAYSHSFDFGPGLLHLGAGAKLLRSTLADAAQATSVAADFGGLYEFPWGQGLPSIAAAASNFGPGIRYSGGLAAGGPSDPLPLTTRLGIGYTRELFAADSLAAGLEVDRIFQDNQMFEGFGFEYNYHGLCALRLGYRFGQSLGGFSAGLGINIKGISLDYSLGLMQTFSSIQQVSVNYRFTIPGIRYSKASGRAPLEVLAGRIQEALAARRYFDAQEEVIRLEMFFPGTPELGRFKERILSEINATLLRGMGSSRYSYALGFKRYYESNWQETVLNLDESLRAEPENAEIRRYLQKARKRLEEFQSQWKLQGEARMGTLFSLANQAFEAGQYDRSERILNEVLRLGPYQPAESLKRKIAKARTRPLAPRPTPRPRPSPQLSPAGARGQDEGASPRNRVRAEQLYYQALSLYAQGNLRGAIENLKEACVLDPDNADYKNPLEHIEKEFRQKERNQ